MAWNEPGGNKPKDPWGGGGAQGPPDLDEALKNLKDKINSVFGGKGGKPVSPRTVEFARAVLRKALEDAVVERLIQGNPVVGSKMPKRDGKPQHTTWTGALALATIVLFATGVVPEFITSIVFFAIAMLFALAPAGVIFSGFQSAGFWMVFGGLVIGAGISSTGLAERLANHVRNRFGSSYAGIIAGIMVVAVTMAFLMP